MILQGNTIYLRPLETEDADGDYPNWLNDKEVCRYNSHGDTLYTKEMAINYIKSTQNSSTCKVFAICDKSSDKHIGNIALQQISHKNQSAEFAILIGKPASYSKGVGYEAGKLLLTYAFVNMKLHRVYCGTHQENIAMQSLALKLGMNKEGRRQEAIFKNEKFADIVEYGLLNTVLMEKHQ